MGLALLGPATAPAQARPWAEVGTQGVVAYERADPVPGGVPLGEVRLLQPAIHLHAGALGRLRLTGMLNLEGLTIPRGELAVGNWGEGFVDRRHPHTYVHELIVSADDLLGTRDGARLSLAAGKGFAPFGSDDPMVRPFLQYPVNHHLAQILERAVVIAAARLGPVTAEAGLFNGDEPERPEQWPRVGGRFGDSWSARLTGAAAPGLSFQASHAQVRSPEQRSGAGTDQSKWSFAGRWAGPIRGHAAYALLEWARTSEAEGFFVFHSFLAEGAWTTGRHRLRYRFERTERPEEERLSRFRTLRPHLENSILGTTRWTIHTAGYELAAMRRHGLAVSPLAEVALARIARVGGGLFDVAGVYGRRHVWSLALGVRVTAGVPMHRMGRYGAAEDRAGGAMGPHEGMPR